MKTAVKVLTTEGIEIFFFNNDFSTGISKAKDFVRELGGTIYTRRFWVFGSWILYRG